MPSDEVLSGMAEVTRILLAVVEDLARHLAGRPSRSPDDLAYEAGLPECMAIPSPVLRFGGDASYKSGIEVVPYEREAGEEAGTRYELQSIQEEIAAMEKMLSEVEVFRFAEGMIPIACRVLETDGSHAPMLWLRHPERGWSIHVLVFEDQASKYAMWHELASHVAAEGYDALVLIADAWLAERPTSEPLQAYEKASEAEGAIEALQVVAEDSDGNGRVWIIPYERADGDLVLGETEQFDDVTTIGFINPIRRVWRERQAASEDPEADLP